MCGFTILFGKDPRSTPLSYYYANQERGGDFSSVIYLPSIDATVVFHRLSIIGTRGSAGDQPIRKHGYIMVCNGEIYNYKELQTQLVGLDSIYAQKGSSDCEVLLDLYHRHKSLDFLSSVDGVYSFVILDVVNRCVCIGRDSYGVRPSYISQCGKAISSTLRGIPRELRENCYQVPPGSKCMYTIGESPTHVKWTSAVLCKTDVFPNRNAKTYIDSMLSDVRKTFIKAGRKRGLHTEREIGCLLSGGLDSSIVAAIVVDIHRSRGGKSTDIHTFTIGMRDSPDVAYARQVANYLGTTHNEWLYSEDLFLKAIPDIIRDTATYDVTTIRASVGNWLVSKKISEKSSVRVLFNGDGADEVCGGYAYTHLAPSIEEFDSDCKRLVDNIYLYDGLRSDRSIAAHGIEARTPFLDKAFVQTYFKIPASLRAPGTIKGAKCWIRSADIFRKITKWFFRLAFKDTHLLPDNILWRHKEAFSDGVSPQDMTWGDITKYHAHQLIPEHLRIEITPDDAERSLYRSLFTEFYGESATCVLPGYWMPKWTDPSLKDPSARTLSCYEVNSASGNLRSLLQPRVFPSKSQQ